MALTRIKVKQALIGELERRFPARTSWPEEFRLSRLGFRTKESLRAWGMTLNNAAWYRGWFTPSEFMSCVTIGRDPENDPSNENMNLIDLMYRTQGRSPEMMAIADELITLSMKRE
jgi:hypothetical protein